jgi:hypothetical protein
VVQPTCALDYKANLRVVKMIKINKSGDARFCGAIGGCHSAVLPVRANSLVPVSWLQVVYAPKRQRSLVHALAAVSHPMSLQCMVSPYSPFCAAAHNDHVLVRVSVC